MKSEKLSLFKNKSKVTRNDYKSIDFEKGKWTTITNFNEGNYDVDDDVYEYVNLNGIFFYVDSRGKIARYAKNEFFLVLHFVVVHETNRSDDER